MLETEQVKLRLTRVPFILDALRAAKRLVLDPVSKEEKLTIQFDSQIFDFKAGKLIVLGRNAANAIVRDSHVIIGGHLTGEVFYGIEEAGKFNIGEQDEIKDVPLTVCPVCKEDFKNLGRLGNHMMRMHKEDRPELYAEEVEKAVVKTEEVVSDEVAA